MIKMFLLISLRKSHCFSSERKLRILGSILNAYSFVAWTWKSERCVVTPWVRWEFCYSNKHCTAENFTLCMPHSDLRTCGAPTVNLYKDEPEYALIPKKWNKTNLPSSCSPWEVVKVEQGREVAAVVLENKNLRCSWSWSHYPDSGNAPIVHVWKTVSIRITDYMVIVKKKTKRTLYYFCFN